MEALHAEVSCLEVHQESVQEASNTVRYQDEVKVEVLRIEDYRPQCRRNVSLSRTDLSNFVSILDLENVMGDRSVHRIEMFVRNEAALDPTTVHTFETLADLFEGDWVSAFEHMLFRRGTAFVTVKFFVADTESEAVESDDGKTDAAESEAVESGDDAAESSDDEAESGEPHAIKKPTRTTRRRRRAKPTDRFDIVAAVGAAASRDESRQYE